LSKSEVAKTENWASFNFDEPQLIDCARRSGMAELVDLVEECDKVFSFWTSSATYVPVCRAASSSLSRRRPTCASYVSPSPTRPVKGLENFAELFRQLTGDRSAIKVYC
jgi:hypothetical protein